MWKSWFPYTRIHSLDSFPYFDHSSSSLIWSYPATSWEADHTNIQSQLWMTFWLCENPILQESAEIIFLKELYKFMKPFISTACYSLVFDIIAAALGWEGII